MPCNLIKSRPMTLREAKALAGYGSEYPDYVTDPKLGARNVARRKADWDRAHEEPLKGSDAPVFMCGSLEIVTCLGASGCQYEGEFLCDWPMGGGKTCDLPICRDHSRRIGDARDLCIIHFGLWQRGGSR